MGSAFDRLDILFYLMISELIENKLVIVLDKHDALTSNTKSQSIAVGPIATVRDGKHRGPI